MNTQIKVGDTASCGTRQNNAVLVLCIDGQEAWVKAPTSDRFTVNLSVLTKIPKTKKVKMWVVPVSIGGHLYFLNNTYPPDSPGKKPNYGYTSICGPIVMVEMEVEDND